MFECDEKPFRFHLSQKFELESSEPVFLDKFDTETWDWIREGDVPEDEKTPELLQPFLRKTALARGGEAWRATTELGEVLRVFSVSDYAKELSGKETITMNPIDQIFLRVARERLGLKSPGRSWL